MKRINHRRTINDCRGFTLAEVLVSVFIFVILASACYTIMASSSSSWQANRVRIQLQQELRKSQGWMINELRQAGSSTITGGPTSADGTPYNTITFRTTTGVAGGAITWSANTIQFSLDGTNLQRVSGGTTRILAQNISLLQIRRQAATPNLIEVTLQAQRTVPSAPTITGNLSFKVQLRN